MKSIEILIMSALAASTIYFAYKAKMYKTHCQMMALCFKKEVGREITAEELRNMAKEELKSQF